MSCSLTMISHGQLPGRPLLHKAPFILIQVSKAFNHKRDPAGLQSMRWCWVIRSSADEGDRDQELAVLGRLQAPMQSAFRPRRLDFATSPPAKRSALDATRQPVARHRRPAIP